VATGWLGWMPEVAWRTPIPELLLAMDARVEWTRMTHPFGGGTAEPEKPKASNVAAKLRAVLTGRGKEE
jgi:hypothetical protein